MGRRFEPDLAGYRLRKKTSIQVLNLLGFPEAEDETVGFVFVRQKKRGGDLRPTVVLNNKLLPRQVSMPTFKALISDAILRFHDSDRSCFRAFVPAAI